MKNIKKNAFTLIELLAVIIILGVLMIIAVPSVTSYISSSRKSAYVDTARQVIGSTRNMVNEGKLGMYDTSATYYIPTSCIKLENGSEAESPYGKFERAFVVVSYDGQGYDYYWTSVDDSGQGIKIITKLADLDNDKLSSDLDGTDIVVENLPGKSKLVEYSADCKSIVHHEDNAGEQGPQTSDGITWTYKDMSLSVNVHLTGCSVQGDGYKYCYGATVDASNISGNTTIKSFVASFDVPAGTVVVNPGYTEGKLRVVVNGTRMTIYGNEGGAIHNYINGQNETFSDGFQIKFPQDANFMLSNASIDYVELISDTQEGNSSSNTAEEINVDTAKLHIRLHRVNMYPGNGVYIEQYEVTVKNNTNQALTNWSFTLDAQGGISNIVMYSQLQVSQSGNSYTFTPMDWYAHKTLNPNEEVTLDSLMEITTSDTNAIPNIR